MKRHSTDPFSLVFGMFFTLIGSLFLFTRFDIAGLHLRWIWPIPLIVFGALIVVLAARRETGPPRATDEESDELLAER